MSTKMDEEDWAYSKRDLMAACEPAFD
jgi:hypothetical protein